MKIRECHKIQGRIYAIDRADDESLDVYFKRVGYILRNIKEIDDIDDIDDIIDLSYIWRNHTLFGMSYPSTVLNRISE